MLPQDPNISYVNTRLRDRYPSLEELCAELDVDAAQLARSLGALGCAYDAGRSQFV